MKIIFGSQNFGFDTEESDKDYMQFIIPSLEQLSSEGMTSKQYKK